MKLFFMVVFILGVISYREMVFSQEPTKNNDLRKPYNLFYLQDLQEKKKLTYKMNSTQIGQFNFTIEVDDKVVNNKKLTSIEAQKFDDLFVDKFISFKYLMKVKEEVSCKKSFYLNLRGEELTICQSEDEKLQEIKVLLKKMKSLFL